MDSRLQDKLSRFTINKRRGIVNVNSTHYALAMPYKITWPWSGWKRYHALSHVFLLSFAFIQLVSWVFESRRQNALDSKVSGEAADSPFPHKGFLYLFLRVSSVPRNAKENSRHNKGITDNVADETSSVKMSHHWLCLMVSSNRSLSSNP